MGIFYFSDIVYQLIEEQVRCYNQVFLVGPGSNIIFEIMKKENNTNTSSFDIFIRCKFKKPLFRRSCPEVLCEKGVPRNFTKFTGKHLCQSLFFDKKETLVQVFCCEFCEISKNTFSYRRPLVAASAY